MNATPTQLIQAAESLFSDFSNAEPTPKLLSHFSSAEPVILELAPYPDNTTESESLTPLIGLNGIRSYFDILAIHWQRENAKCHRMLVDGQQVVIWASVRWRRRRSGQSWKEEFTWTLEFDQPLKVKRFSVRTTSGDSTAVI